MIEVLAEGGDFVGGSFRGEVAAVGEGVLGVDALVEQSKGFELAHPQTVRLQPPQRRLVGLRPVLFARNGDAGDGGLLLQLVLHVLLSEG